MIRSFLRWATVCLAGWSATAAQPATIEPPHPGAWLVFLCQASDDADEPRPTSHYQELFEARDPDLVHAYLKWVSFGQVDITGTVVMGWFRTRASTEALSPEVRNASTVPGREQSAVDCKDAGIESLAARGQTIEPQRWAGFIGIFNVPVDAGAVDENVIGNKLEEAAFFEHEMLHRLGVAHTYNLPNNQGADHRWGSPLTQPYNDPWDIMSYDIGNFSMQSARYGKTGPELNMAYRSLRGWLPEARIVTRAVSGERTRTRATHTLAPVGDPLQPGPLLLVMKFANGVRYAVEYRKPVGFDRAIPRGEVVVREWRADGVTHLVRQVNGHIGYVPGDPPFVDKKNSLRITVVSIAPDGNAATVEVDTRVPTPQACEATCDRERAVCLAAAGNPGGPAASRCRIFHSDCVADCKGRR